MGQSSRKAGSNVGVAPVADETAATSEAARKKRSTESASEARRRREADRLGVRRADEANRTEWEEKAASSKQAAVGGKAATTRAWRSSQASSVFWGCLRRWRTAASVAHREAWCVSASSEGSSEGVKLTSAVVGEGFVGMGLGGVKLASAVVREGFVVMESGRSDA